MNQFSFTKQFFLAKFWNLLFLEVLTDLIAFETCHYSIMRDLDKQKDSRKDRAAYGVPDPPLDKICLKVSEEVQGQATFYHLNASVLA